MAMKSSTLGKVEMGGGCVATCERFMCDVQSLFMVSNNGYISKIRPLAVIGFLERSLALVPKCEMLHGIITVGGWPVYHLLWW